MSDLAAALTLAMTGSPNSLTILDSATAQWRDHPWTEVHALAQSVAARILDRDRGGAVGLVGEPTVEFVAAIQGAWLAGAAVSILPGPVRGADARQWAGATVARFDRIGARTVLTHGDHLQLLRDGDAPNLLVDDVTAAARGPAPAYVHTPDTGSAAVLQGTAGTTGVPRTAVLSPSAVLNNVRGLIERAQVDATRDVGCTWLPLYHDMGLTFLLAGALTGSPLCLAPTSAFAASPFRWLNWLSQSGATLTGAPNFAYNLLGKYARRVSEVDLSALRYAINGGEPVDCAGLARFTDAMSAFGFDASAAAPSYGLAESTCAVTAPARAAGLRFDDVTDDTGTHRHAILGHAIPGMQVRIVARDDQSGPPGRDAGEVEIRGTSMMDGYLGEAAIDRDDWFPTGDLGYFTDGGLVVCGRVKEMISVAGRNIFPTEVERVAAEVRGVREGAVVAVGTGERSIRPGLVVAAEFRGCDETSAREEVTRRVASVCGVVPADVVFMAPGSLPRTSSGKLRRLEVRRTLEEAGRS